MLPLPFFFEFYLIMHCYPMLKVTVPHGELVNRIALILMTKSFCFALEFKACQQPTDAFRLGRQLHRCRRSFLRIGCVLLGDPVDLTETLIDL